MTAMTTSIEGGQGIVGYDFISGPVLKSAGRPSQEAITGLYVADLAATVLVEHGFVPTSLREMHMVVDGDDTLLRLMGGKDVLFVPRPPRQMYRRDVRDVDTEAIARRSAVDLNELTELKTELDECSNTGISVLRALGSRDAGVPQLIRHHDLTGVVARQAVGFMPFISKPSREFRTADPYTTKKADKARISKIAGVMTVAEASLLTDDAIKQQVSRRGYWAQRVADHEAELQRRRESKASVEFPQDPTTGQLRFM